MGSLSTPLGAGRTRPVWKEPNRLHANISMAKLRELRLQGLRIKKAREAALSQGGPRMDAGAGSWPGPQ